MRDLIEVALAILCIIIVMALAVVLPLDYLIKQSCAKHELITGQKTQYLSFDSCYVEHEGAMYRYKDYSNMLLARDGLSNHSAKQ